MTYFTYATICAAITSFYFRWQGKCEWTLVCDGENNNIIIQTKIQNAKEKGGFRTSGLSIGSQINYCVKIIHRMERREP